MQTVLKWNRREFAAETKCRHLRRGSVAVLNRFYVQQRVSN